MPIEQKAAQPAKISAVLITRNEEAKLPDCLRSLSFVDEIVIVDSGSTDTTPQIAAQYGARFIFHPFQNFAAQKNEAFRHATEEWILSLDADERISPELAEEIQAAVQNPQGCNGFWIPRQNYFFGTSMRHGAQAGDLQLRLICRGRGQFEGAVHERIKLQGKSAALKAPMLHYSTENLEDYLRRLSLYTDLEAEKIHSKGIPPTAVHIVLRPLAEFIYFYIFRLGFLDGLAGLQYQVLSSFYTSLKFMKALELFKKTPQPLREKIAI